MFPLKMVIFHSYVKLPEGMDLPINRYFTGMSLGFHWDVTGISLGFHWDVTGISLGCHWDFMVLNLISWDIQTFLFWRGHRDA